MKNELTKAYTKLNNSLRTNPNKIIELNNNNFKNGTVIIDDEWILYTNDIGNTVKLNQNTKGYTFQLVENIIFNPNPVPDVENPTARQVAEASRVINEVYDKSVFGIGFFAALIVQARDVIIDLNGYEIKQADEHALHQRFYSNIELASVPFIPKQGPHTFSNTIKPANRCIIKNGTIGRSSHHGIHGNNNTNIIIQDIDFIDYEVGLIALNGCRNVYVSNINGNGHFTKVPVLGIFSTARFIWQFLQELDNTELVLHNRTLTKTEVINELEESMKQVYIDVIRNKTTVSNSLYRNDKGLVDGNSYGILFNQVGVAVNGFPINRNNPSENIYLKNIFIKDHISFVNEIPAVESPEGKVEKDVLGSVLQLQNGTHTINEEGVYMGNVVSNAQLFCTQGIINNDIFMGVKAEDCNCVKRNTISNRTMEWVRQGTKLSDIDIVFTFNTDSMFHVNKGLITYKLDAVDGLYAENCTSINTRNMTDKYAETKDTLIGWSVPDYHVNDYTLYTHRLDKAVDIATYTGNNGHRVRAWSLASSNNCMLNNCTARNIESLLGTVCAFDIHQDSSNITLEDCTVYNILGGSQVKSTVDIFNHSMMGIPETIGIRADNLCNSITINNCTIDIKNKSLYTHWIKHKEILSRS